MYHFDFLLYIKIAASEGCGDFSFGLFAVLVLFALLIGDTAGGFACGLAGGLTFTAAAFRSGYRKVSRFQSGNSLHCLHLLSCGVLLFIISYFRGMSRETRPSFADGGVLGIDFVHDKILA